MGIAHHFADTRPPGGQWPPYEFLRTACVAFSYDHRGRLIRERRTEGASDAYDISYAYDQLGNRLSKIDAVAGLWTVYDYDVHEDWDFENELYGSWDNRLLRYRVYDGNPETGTLLRTVTYTYYVTGQTSNITIKDEDPNPDPLNGPDPAYDKYRDLALYYYRGGGTLWRALWGEFKRYPSGAAYDYAAADAREFSWDSPRARLTTLDFDRGQSQSNDPSTWSIESTHRTDHVGDSPYRDLAAAGAGSPVEYMQYLGTAARQPVTGQGVPTDLEFLHGDLIGSTLAVSDDNGIPKEFPTGGGGGGSGGGGGPAVTSVAYTAFGELLTSAGAPGGAEPTGFPRYQYAGEHGYESGVLSLQGVNTALPPVTLQHVGYRWYQPEIGRFVQRDPIGLRGGLNVYVYCINDPLCAIDPDGLAWYHKAFLWITGGQRQSIFGLDNPTTVASAQSVCRKVGGAAAGTAAVLVFPPLVYPAMVWGGFRCFGNGTSGIPAIDDLADGASIGIGIGSLPGIKAPGGPPRTGTLGGFPGTSNPPYIY